MREYLDVLARFPSSPHRQPVGGPIAGPAALADEFLRLACLTYGVTDGADDRRRPARARALLDAHPELATASIHTVAAVGEVTTARELLAEDATLAGRAVASRPDLLATVGFDVNAGTWATPLHPATYEGHLEVVKLLVELGADPSARVADFKPGDDPLASVEDPTALGWARHTDRHEVAAYLAGLDPARA